jgi:hypothetical protein
MKSQKELEFQKIREQSKFCTELMNRLNTEIKNSGEGSWSGMENHYRKMDDIKRIRRELLTLAKMLDPWGRG